MTSNDDAYKARFTYTFTRPSFAWGPVRLPGSGSPRLSATASHQFVADLARAGWREDRTLS